MLRQVGTVNTDGADNNALTLVAQGVLKTAQVLAALVTAVVATADVACPTAAVKAHADVASEFGPRRQDKIVGRGIGEAAAKANAGDGVGANDGPHHGRVWLESKPGVGVIEAVDGARLLSISKRPSKVRP